MKTLIILRHAKSDWQDGNLPDHDRPLAPRGERAATVIGRYIGQTGPLPDLVLCSTARRAVDTLALAQAEWPPHPVRTAYDRGLYLTGRTAILKRLAAIEDDANTVLVVGHNPDAQQLTLSLGANGPAEIIGEIERKFPTAALATIALPIDRWSGIPSAVGRIAGYMTPKRLP